MNNITQIRKGILVALVLVATIFSLTAQKYGHLNSTLLMADLPAVKTADSDLQTYQTQLSKKGEDMVKKFQANYEAYQVKVNSGTLSQVQAQEIEGTLAEEQTTIQSFQQEAQDMVLKKRQELYDPIFAGVRSIIEQYGKDNGYTMIFDAGMGAILFEDSEDLTEMIKAKL